MAHVAWANRDTFLYTIKRKREKKRMSERKIQWISLNEQHFFSPPKRKSFTWKAICLHNAHSLSKQNYVECAHENLNGPWLEKQGHPMRIKITTCHRGLNTKVLLHTARRCLYVAVCACVCVCVWPKSMPLKQIK